jgi:small nuclear ribonucleoprotein (snRNP)-like protein
VGTSEGEGIGGQIWSMYFVDVYENRKMKPVTIILRNGRMMEGMNIIMVYCKDISKCYNETPQYNEAC